MRRFVRKSERNNQEIQTSTQSHVRGPNSALTEFLRERNIDANAIRLRHQERQNQARANSTDPSNSDEGGRPSTEPTEQQDSDVEIVDQEPTTSSSTTTTTTGTKRKRLSKEKEKQRSKAEQRRLNRSRRERKNIAPEDDDQEDEFSSDDPGYNSAGNRVRRPRRRNRQRDVFQNDENNETLFRIQHGNQGRLPGQTDFCARCHCKFTVTVYSESAPPELQQEIIVEETVVAENREEDDEENSDTPAREDQENTTTTTTTTTKKKVTRLAGTLLLCPACSKEQLEKGKQSRAAAAHDEAVKNSKMYRRKVAAAILDRQDYKNVPTLRSICINVIQDNIQDVEALGGIGDDNRDRIARILARNRKLDSESVKIFLEPTVRKLELWDCSQINSTSLNLIPQYCPHLESLTLSMCGQLDSSFLTRCSSMSNLTSISLDGAFLVSSDSWAKFFEQIGNKLTRLDIRNTHRFDAKALQALVDNCAQGLTHLTLNRMSGLDDPAAFFALSKLTNLVHLEYSHPPQELVLAKDRTLFTDEIIIEILNSVGSQLHTLILDGCAELTDKFIINGVKPCCSPLRMRKLSLGQLDLLTDEVVADLFHSWNDLLVSTKTVPILTDVSLERCIGLGDDTVDALFELARPSLVSLNLSALPDLGEDPFIRAFVGEDVAKFKSLENLNLSFVRSVTNSTITAIAENSPWLEFIEVFGNPKINKNCVVRKGVKLIGRQDIFDL